MPSYTPSTPTPPPIHPYLSGAISALIMVHVAGHQLTRGRGLGSDGAQEVSHCPAAEPAATSRSPTTAPPPPRPFRTPPCCRRPPSPRSGRLHFLLPPSREQRNMEEAFGRQAGRQGDAPPPSFSPAIRYNPDGGLLEFL